MKLMANSEIQQTPIFLALFKIGSWYLAGMGKCQSEKSIGSSSFDQLEESFTFKSGITSSFLLMSSNNLQILLSYFIFSLRLQVTSAFFFMMNLNSKAKRMIYKTKMIQKMQGIDSSISKGSCCFLSPKLFQSQVPLIRFQSRSKISTLILKDIMIELNSSELIFKLNVEFISRYIIGIDTWSYVCHNRSQNFLFIKVSQSMLEKSAKLQSQVFISVILFSFCEPYLAISQTCELTQLQLLGRTNMLFTFRSQRVSFSLQKTACMCQYRQYSPVLQQMTSVPSQISCEQCSKMISLKQF